MTTEMTIETHTIYIVLTNNHNKNLIKIFNKVLVHILFILDCF